MDIYTASYGYAGPDRLDVTVKGNDPLGRIFAPTWDMVNNLHSGIIDEDTYERMYRSLMNERFRTSGHSFSSVTKGEGSKTVVCFCKAGEFCHRIILVEGLEKLGAIYKGERNYRFENENVYTSGDMLAVKKGILCHQVNCKGVMGAGLAKAITSKWPEVGRMYSDLCQKTLITGESVKNLGTAYPIPISEDLYVANLFGQDGYGKDKRQTNYPALRKALKQLKTWRDIDAEMFGRKLPIYFPYRMSCGLAGGDWYLVFKMISDIFPDAIIVRKE